MQRMFTAASVRSRPVPRGDAAAPSSDALLDDILGDLGPGDSTGCVAVVDWGFGTYKSRNHMRVSHF